MKSQVLHTVWHNISGEVAGEIWKLSLLGVKWLMALMLKKKNRGVWPVLKGNWQLVKLQLQQLLRSTASEKIIIITHAPWGDEA